MADSQDDVQSEITPEDFDGKQETPQAESSTADKPEANVTEETDKPETDVTPPETEEVETPEGEDSVETEEDKPTKAEERKAQLNTEIRDLVSQRNALRKEVEQANSEVYQPATEDELTEQVNPDTGENYTRLEAKLEEMRQAQEIERYNSQVAEAQLTLGSESERVLNDFPIFNPDSEQYDKELAEEAAGLLEANLVIDPNTEQVIGSNVSPYQLYKTLAKAHGISAVKGQLKGQQATERQLANVDSGNSASPPQKPKDPLTELWKDEL